MYKVFIIQMTRMGDIIQTLPLLKRLHEVHPDVQITFLCVSEFSEIIRYSPLIHRYIKITASEAYSLKNSDAKKTVMNKILSHPFIKERYDLVINLTHDSESGYISGFIKSGNKAGLVCEEEPAGYIPDSWGRYLFSVVRNRLENSFNLVDIHIGMGKIPHKPVDNYLTVHERAFQNVQAWLGKIADIQRHPLVIFHLGASKAHRVWPVDFFVRLGIMLVREASAVIILTGRGNQEKLSASKFLKLWREAKQSVSFIIDTVDKLDVHHLTALISRASLLISGDTGPIHIAAATGTKTIGIYLATAYPGETAPYGRNHVVISPNMHCYPCLKVPEMGACNMECINQIKPEYVFSIAEEILEKDYSNISKVPGNGKEIRVKKSAFLSNGTLFYFPLDGKENNRTFSQQIIYRVLWESILGIESDINLINMIDLSSFKMLAHNTLNSLVNAKADALVVQKALKHLNARSSIKDPAMKNLCISEEIFKSRLDGILRDYFSLVPPVPLKSQEDFLRLWEIRLEDLNIAIDTLKKLVS